MSNQPLFSPDILEMVTQTVELMKLDIVQGLAYEQEPNTYHKRGIAKNPSKLGQIVATHLKKLSPHSKYKRADFSKTLPVNKLYTAEIRTLSRRHNIDLVSDKSVISQLNTAKKFEFITNDISNPVKLESIHENLFDTQVDISKTSPSPNFFINTSTPYLKLDSGVARILSDKFKWKFDYKDYNNNNNDTSEDNNNDSEVIQLNKGLKFKLHRVKCIDETNPEWPGDDEIAMVGTAVDSNEISTKINEFRVGNSFDDGESKVYSPPRILKNYNLNTLNYPANFLIILALAEKDSGGLSDFIDELWKSIKDQVTIIISAVSAAAGAAIGAAIGGTLGTTIGGPLGTIIGLIAGAIIGSLVGWLIDALNDDIFRPQSAALQLPVHNATFENGSLTSQIMTLNFSDHGGHYRAFYSWEIIR